MKTVERTRVRQDTINHSHAGVEQHKNLLDIVQICWLFATVALEARTAALLWLDDDEEVEEECRHGMVFAIQH